jgi:ABC-2 type transport system permease protein
MTSQLAALYRLMLRTQLTRARLLSLVGLGLVGVVVGFALGQSDVADPLASGARFVNAFGLSLLVPVATLVFASATLGEPNEDGTLVYLWLRPVPRWVIVAAATASAFTVTWPVVVVPLVLATLLTGAGASLVGGTVAATTAAMLAYTGVFVALGLRVKRALVWGLLYIFIWEGFVATANLAAARLAIRSYSRSILSDVTGTSLRLADFTLASSWLVPLAVGVVAFAYAARRLARMDVA